MVETKTFHDEIRRYRRSLARWNLRYHLSKYPRDLLRYWIDEEGALPVGTCSTAFRAWQAGVKPGRLYKGPPWRPQLRVVAGGKS
ncbi:hypothetical protein Q3C01_01120 [Bradyrhizobium sp. UFLA05-109]